METNNIYNNINENNVNVEENENNANNVDLCK